MINEIKFTKRFNIGEYQHEEYGVSYTVNEEECPAKAMQNLKKFIQDAHSNKLSVKLEEVVEVGAEVKTEKGEVRDAEMVVVEPELEAPDHLEKPKKVGRKRKSRSKSDFVKNVPYNRELPEHKKELAAILNKEVPNWKATEESKAAAKELSIELHTTKFMDGKTGEVLQAFIDKIIKGMSESL